MNNIVACFAQIDGCEKKFPCRADPRKRWNGWGQPYFTKEVMLEVLKELGQGADVVIEEKEIVFFFNGEQETADLTENGWTIYGYCWDLVDEKGNYI